MLDLYRDSDVMHSSVLQTCSSVVCSGVMLYSRFYNVNTNTRHCTTHPLPTTHYPDYYTLTTRNQRVKSGRFIRIHKYSEAKEMFSKNYDKIS